MRRVLRTTALGLSLIAAATACSGDDKATRDASGAVTKETKWSTFDLRAGDCLRPAADIEGDIDTIPVVPCAEPHTQEVFSLVDSEADAFPGVGALATWADGACVGSLQTSLGVSPSDGYFVSYLLPSFDSWNKKDDRSAVCVLVFPKDAEKKGSIVAERRAATGTATTVAATSTTKGK